MKVKAIKQGFHGGARRYPGDVFEVPKGSKAAWFVPVDGGQATAPKALGPNGTDQAKATGSKQQDEPGAGDEQ